MNMKHNLAIFQSGGISHSLLKIDKLGITINLTEEGHPNAL